MFGGHVHCACSRFTATSHLPLPTSRFIHFSYTFPTLLRALFPHSSDTLPTLFLHYSYTLPTLFLHSSDTLPNTLPNTLPTLFLHSSYYSLVILLLLGLLLLP